MWTGPITAFQKKVLPKEDFSRKRRTAAGPVHAVAYSFCVAMKESKRLSAKRNHNTWSRWKARRSA